MSKESKEFEPNQEEIKETGFIFKSVKHLNPPPLPVVCLTFASLTVVCMMAGDLFPVRLRGGRRWPPPKPQDSTSDPQQNRSCAGHRHVEAGQHLQMLHSQLLFPTSLKSHYVAFSLDRALRNTGKRSVRDYTSDDITSQIFHLPCFAIRAVQCANASAQGGLNHLALLQVW